MAKRFNFDGKLREFKKLKRTLARKTANNTRNFFLQAFRKQGWTDRTFTAWDKRKAVKDTRPGRAILVDSNNLRSSIRVRSVSFPISRIGSYNLAYNRIHNRGGTTHPKVTPKMRAFMWRQFKKTGNPVFKAIALTKKERLDITIPRRQFIGRSFTLTRSNSKIINLELSKLLRRQ